MINLQIATKAECHHIHRNLLLLLDKSPAAQMKLAEPRTAFDALLGAVDQQRLFVYGDFAILVDVGSPWYTSKLVLIEEIILRYRRDYGNTVDSAIAQLEVLAREFGCSAIAAGDTQPVQLMSPRYAARGYTKLGIQWFKEIHADGVHP